MMKKLVSYYKRLVYYFSPDKKILDYYVLKLRRLERLTDSEVQRFKELAEAEKEIYS